MLIEEYLQMRIQSAGSILAGEELAGNVPKAMAEKAAIAELRGVEAFLNNASKSSEVANDFATPNKSSPKFPSLGEFVREAERFKEDGDTLGGVTTIDIIEHLHDFVIRKHSGN